MTKPWYASKTIWGGVASIVAGVYMLFGVDVDQQHFAETLSELAAVVGGLLAVVGRIPPDIQPIRKQK